MQRAENMEHVEQGHLQSQRARPEECGPLVPHRDALREWWARNRIAHGRRPLLGAAIVGGTALALATNFGALELAIGALAGYTAYRMLRYGIDLREALIETIEVEELCRREL
jgi:hypothetical protein